MPLILCNSPDGACLTAISVESTGQCTLEAYHWASFGSTPGHQIILPDFSAAPFSTFAFTSFVERNRVHLLSLSLADSCCQSFVLEISKKATEYAFTAKGSTRLAGDPTASSASNALIECLSDVWTRFPVVPAIGRATITSSRASSCFVFVTDRDHRNYAGQFTESVRAFEQTTRKPTGGKLAAIGIDAVDFEHARYDVLQRSSFFSTFQAGEWLIEALCLIPIQIAITRENRYVTQSWEHTPRRPSLDTYIGLRP